MTNLERIRRELSPDRRKKIAVRATQLIAEDEPDPLPLIRVHRAPKYPHKTVRKQRLAPPHPVV